MTDLAREIAELPFLGCDCGLTREHLWHCPSLLRPAILAFITRKLDEVRADSELLEKVGALMLGHTDSLHVYWTSRDGRPQSGGTQYWLRWGDQINDCGAPTLREALRALVGGGE